MWLTGFDVKPLSCLYLDKPLKAHTLMQTIARANRVCEGKSNGLVVDYIGVVKALRKALADYTANGGAGSTEPTVDKQKLLDRIAETADAAEAFLAEKGFVLQTLIDAADFCKIDMQKAAADAVCVSVEDRRTFTTYASELKHLKRFTEPKELSDSVWKKVDAIQAISDVLGKKRRHADTTDLMVQINAIINDYVEIEPQTEGVTESRQFDISKIDFDLLRREFARSKRKNLVLKDLQELIQERISSLLFSNPARINYYDRYQQIINDYNSEMNRASIEKTFMDLMNLADSMGEEEKRYVREGFQSDEELSFYDLLFKEDLSQNDIRKIKEIAADLLQKVKAKIAEFDHWTDKQETKAAVSNLIRGELWNELPESYDAQIDEYRERIFEYVYTRYKETA